MSLKTRVAKLEPEPEPQNETERLRAARFWYKVERQLFHREWPKDVTPQWLDNYVHDPRPIEEVLRENHRVD